MKKIDQIEIIGTYDGIKLINICEWLDSMYGDDWPSVSFGKTTSDLREYCETFNCNYYAAPRESFNYIDALKDTEAKGMTYCIVEDLS